MNFDRVTSSIKRHEGYSQIPYQDSLGNLTGGWGHLLEHRRLDQYPESKTLGDLFRELTDPVAHAAWLDADIEQATADAMNFAGHSWESLTDERREVLVEMAFQLGGPNLRSFVRFRDALCLSQWAQAKAEMLNSRWARQTPNRAEVLADKLYYSQDSTTVAS